MSSKRSLGGKSKDGEGRSGEKSSRSGGNWCEANVNAKQAWKSGTEKLTQTINNVRTTFGVFSQRIRKSTRKRQPLINMDSPRSPATPYTRSRAALGRTPTKLYSPFSIDTPKGKENISSRFAVDETDSSEASTKPGKRRPKRTKLNLNICEGNHPNNGETVLSNDMLQTQIGIYEFQSVANRIVQNCGNY